MSRPIRKGQPKLITTRIDIVYDVLTVVEAAHMFGFTYNAIIGNILRGHLIARKSGRWWLISYLSLVAIYGNPIHDYLDSEDHI
jgi:hypothetical protein